MTEKSFLWQTGVAGDGSTPYTESETAAMFAGMFLTDASKEGVFALDNFYGITLNNHAVSPTVDINTGRGIVRGILHRSDASVNLAITLPVVDTTGWRVVLQGLGASNTVRLTVLMNTDGDDTAPSVTQDAGFPSSGTWEVALYSGTVTTGGVLTSVDERYIVRPVVYNRQGGSATVWATTGATNYKAGRPVIQVGATTVTILNGNASASATVTYPEAFKYTPLVFCQLVEDSGSDEFTRVMVTQTDETAFDVTLTVGAAVGGDTPIVVNWVAFGPRDV